MSITEFISSAPAERQAFMTALHEAIIANDSTVTPVVKPMMGKDTILYEEGTTMKYGLAGGKAHLSLHCLPMYMDPALHQEFEKLLPNAKVQKGCINFKDESELPVAIAAQLIAKCSGVNITAMLANRKKK